MNRLVKILASMKEDELKNLLKDVEEGNMERLINKRLFILKNQKEKLCPVCGSTLNPGESFKLEFGPPDLRKKAHFCAMDCLEFFIQKLKSTQTKESMTKIRGSG